MADEIHTSGLVRLLNALFPRRKKKTKPLIEGTDYYWSAAKGFSHRDPSYTTR